MPQPTPPKGPSCQSCGMPLEKLSDLGTSAAGTRVDDYCHFCFQNGRFTEPNITPSAMIDRCVGLMVRQGIMPEAEARPLMAGVIPRLKRWQGATVTEARSPVSARA